MFVTSSRGPHATDVVALGLPYMEFERSADPVHSAVRSVSAFSEPGPPLLQEGVHAFTLVRRAEEGTEELPLAREAGRAGRLVRGADGGLGGGDRPSWTVR